MTPEEVMVLFRNTGALLDGHFLYTSGRHGRAFLQAARVLQYPKHAERLCAALANCFSYECVDLVVGPATGGIVLAYETARHLGARAAYSEKREDKSMAVGRGIAIPAGCRTLVVEDVVTTGLSVSRTLDHLKQRGADIVGVGALIDRSGGKTVFPYPFRALATLDLESWEPSGCPLCAEGLPLVDPDECAV